MSVKYANKITSSIKDLRDLISANSKIKERIVSEVISQFNPIHILIRSDDGLSIKINLPDEINVPANLPKYHSMFVDIIRLVTKENDYNLQVDSNICITVRNGHNSVLFTI